jgi:hypothetical protein
MNLEALKKEALDWVNAWNNRNIEHIMDHYSEDIEFYSPSVVDRWNIKEGKLSGKAALQRHFLKGFELAPSLHFELIDILSGMDGILVVYKRETGKIVADYVVPDEEGKAKLVKVFAAAAGS